MVLKDQTMINLLISELYSVVKKLALMFYNFFQNRKFRKIGEQATAFGAFALDLVKFRESIIQLSYNEGTDGYFTVCVFIAKSKLMPKANNIYVGEKYFHWEEIQKDLNLFLTEGIIEIRTNEKDKLGLLETDAENLKEMIANSDLPSIIRLAKKNRVLSFFLTSQGERFANVFKNGSVDIEKRSAKS